MFKVDQVAVEPQFSWLLSQQNDLWPKWSHLCSAQVHASAFLSLDLTPFHEKMPQKNY